MKKKVAIITIICRRNLKDFQKLSLEFSKKNLSKYDRFLVMPESFDKIDPKFNSIKFKIEKFPDKCFKSISEYNKLVTSSVFYKRFKDYEYILFCELDTLVFKDELEYFCSLGYDYIGAPFINNRLKKIENTKEIKHRNGGLSLRKVSSFIEVAEKQEKAFFRESWFLEYYLNNFFKFNINRIKSLIRGRTLISKMFFVPEDVFWSNGVKKINHLFRVAPFHIALSFSFENNVALSFKANHNKLPFGCHAFQCEKNLKEWKKLGVFKKTSFFLNFT